MYLGPHSILFHLCVRDVQEDLPRYFYVHLFGVTTKFVGRPGPTPPDPTPAHRRQSPTLQVLGRGRRRTCRLRLSREVRLVVPVFRELSLVTSLVVPVFRSIHTRTAEVPGLSIFPLESSSVVRPACTDFRPPSGRTYNQNLLVSTEDPTTKEL